jgi:SAM-dependent methyltransferase
MFNVNAALKWSRRVLKADGMLFMDDFVGPNRFQWSEASLRAASRIRQGLPERLRKSAHENQEEVPLQVRRPSKRRIKREDPSEAPDSARILKKLQRIFPKAHVVRTGGLVYNLALTHTLHNFDEDDEIDRQILRDLMLLDQVLLDNPAIDNHYAVALAWADGRPVELENDRSALSSTPPAHHCPICESSFDEFVRGGHYGRPGAKCPECGALERHRAAWLYLDRERPWEQVDGRPFRLLHVAPEAPLERRFRRIPSVEYLSVDIEPGKAMATMDLTRVATPEAPYDLIFCSHVLEHIPDDAAAMRGLYRLVREGGLVLVQVPMRGQETYEDASITSPGERRKAFGQEDHVRIYGADIVDRLQAAGFKAEIVHPDGALDGAQKRRLNTGNRPLIVCRK